MPGLAALLLLSDGRWPTGGHAHSGGLEPAVRAGLVTDAVTLEKWLRGRLHTTGSVDASFAAVAWTLAESTGSAAWAVLIDEYWARVPAPSLREASRAMGRAVLRAARTTWPVGADRAGADLAGADRAGADRAGADWPWPLAFAAAARAGAVDRPSTAVAVAAASIQGPAWSATRLMGLDPYLVAGCLSRLAGEVEEIGGRATGVDPAALPSLSAPLLDIGAGQHATWEVRLFAS